VADGVVERIVIRRMRQILGAVRETARHQFQRVGENGKSRLRKCDEEVFVNQIDSAGLPAAGIGHHGLPGLFLRQALQQQPGIAHRNDRDEVQVGCRPVDADQKTPPNVETETPEIGRPGDRWFLFSKILADTFEETTRLADRIGGSFVSAIMKNIRRVAAGDYSRDLSARVFAGSCRIIILGFKTGGTPGYGLQRVLVDQFGTERCVLKPGDRKSLHSDRVVLRPGPPKAVKMVQQVFRWFVLERKSELEIARELNERKILNEFGRPSRHQLRDASAVLENFARHPKKTFSTLSAMNGSRLIIISQP